MKRLFRFFFVSDKALRQWCVEITASFDGPNLNKAREVYNFICGKEEVKGQKS